MDIQLEKYKILEWLIGLKDESVISQIKDIKNQSEDAWSHELSETEKLFLKAGLKDIDDGHIYPHDQVMEEITKTYGL